jgi:nucleoporin NDC1
LISDSFKERRKTVFAEVDRVDASTWKQILTACLSVLKDMDTRIVDLKSPPPEMTLKDSEQKQVKALPQLSEPLKTENILQASPGPSNKAAWIENQVSTIAKGISQKPSKDAPESPARKLLTKVRDHALSPQQQNILQPEKLSGLAESIAGSLLSSRVGFLFQQTFAQRAQVKVLGTPRSDLANIIFAVDSIARLAVAAITEDSMGTVYKDIPLIMRTLGNIIGRIQTFLQTSPIHWTDVSFAQAGEDARRVTEIEFVLGHLRGALRHIIQGYELYARDMGIAPTELRAAKMAAKLDI